MKIRWTQKNVEKLIKLLKKSNSIEEAVLRTQQIFGRVVTSETIKRVLKEKSELSIPDLLNERAAQQGIDEFVSILKNSKKGKGFLTLEDLCNRLDKTPNDVRKLIKIAENKGYKFKIGSERIVVDNKEEEVFDLTEVQETATKLPNRTKTIKIGIISDTHFGSKAALTACVKDFIHKAYDEHGIRTILHCGDILAGNGVYKGQMAELSYWACDDQCDAAIEGMPKLDGLNYYAILGNHDVDFIKKVGVDPGRKLSKSRDDIHIVGQLKGKVILRPENIIIEMLHIKSSAHARSYVLEKYMTRAIFKGDLPHVILEGHRHTAGYFALNGVQCLLVPCFEDRNMFVKYHGFVPEVGGTILTLELDENNTIVGCTPQFIFYNSEQDIPVSVNS
jgi:predicted phosphodiesterase